MSARTDEAPRVATEARDAGASRRPAGRVLLSLVTSDNVGDGVTHVGALLRRALGDLATQVSEARFQPAVPGASRPAEMAAFLARVAWRQLRGAEWTMFNHVGIAAVERRLPAAWRRPYGVFLHGLETWDPGYGPARMHLAREASLRLCNSWFTQRRVAELYPDLGPVHVCPLTRQGVPRAAAGEADHAMVARVGASAVCIVGRMSAAERYKGHDELLDCWPRVRAAVPAAQLVVVGRGSDVERLRARAAAIDAGDSVLFTGYVSDATRDLILARSALFAMPSRHEGFGIVYLDAMAAGLPCIASTADAAGDVVEHGATGLLVDPDDAAALAGAIVRLLRNPDERRRMGDAGRRREAAVFTYERFRDAVAGAIAGTPAIASLARAGGHR